MYTAVLPAPRRRGQGDQKLHGEPHREFQASLGYMRFYPRKVAAQLLWVPGASDAQI